MARPRVAGNRGARAMPPQDKTLLVFGLHACALTLAHAPLDVLEVVYA